MGMNNAKFRVVLSPRTREPASFVGAGRRHETSGSEHRLYYSWQRQCELRVYAGSPCSLPKGTVQG